MTLSTINLCLQNFKVSTLDHIDFGFMGGFEEFPEVFGLSENDREGPGVTSRAATTRPVRLLYFSSAVSSADQRGCVDDKLLSVSLPIGRSQVEDDDCL